MIHFLLTGKISANAVFELSQGRQIEARQAHIPPNQQQHGNQQHNYMPGGFIQALEQDVNGPQNFENYVFQ